MDREAILREGAEEQLLREASQRRFLYQDVEELIQHGFLSHTLYIEGRSVVMRSLLPQDQRRLEARSRGGQYTQWSVASAIWMVDGFEIDPAKNGAYHIYTEWVRNLPKPSIEALSYTVLGLSNRVSRAIRLTESFCYEQYSRGLWKMLGAPTQGLENANVVRRLWAAYNSTEDTEKADEKQWSHTRAVVGSMSNKGAKHLSEELEKYDDREKARKQRVIEEAVNWVIRGDEKQEPLTVVVGGKVLEVPHIHSAQTTEDLEEEMRRVFTGEQDWHDHLVAQYQNQIRHGVIEKREARQEMIREARARADAAEDQGSPAIVGYTPEQLAQLRPDVNTKRTTVAAPQSADANHMFDRYLNPEMRPGVLTPGLKVEDPSMREASAYAGRSETPEEAEEELSLQEKIQRRTPKVEPGEP